MITFRARNPEILELLKPHLIEEEGISTDRIMAETAEVMIQTPDSAFIIVTVEEVDDETVLKAYAMAFDVTGRDHVFVHQAWSDSQFSKDHPKESQKIFDQIKDWAKEREISQVRIETLRTPSAIARKYGFKNFSTIMKYEVPKEKE